MPKAAAPKHPAAQGAVPPERRVRTAASCHWCTFRGSVPDEVELIRSANRNLYRCVDHDRCRLLAIENRERRTAKPPMLALA